MIASKLPVPKIHRADKSYHFTHLGKKEIQEDALGISVDHKLFLICDGVGGSARGDIAAKVVCKSILSRYEKVKDRTTHRNIKELITYAQIKLVEQVQNRPNLEGMSTTLVLLFLQDYQASILHIGDSRGYYFGKEGAYFATRDDSVVQDLYDAGVISNKTDMRKHPMSHQITNALKGRQAYSPPAFNQELITYEPEDIFLLGSDGAFEHYSDEELKNHFRNEDLTLDSRWSVFKNHCAEHSVDNNTGLLIKVGV